MNSLVSVLLCFLSALKLVHSLTFPSIINVLSGSIIAMVYKTKLANSPWHQNRLLAVLMGEFQLHNSQIAFSLYVAYNVQKIKVFQTDDHCSDG